MGLDRDLGLFSFPRGISTLGNGQRINSTARELMSFPTARDMRGVFEIILDRAREPSITSMGISTLETGRTTKSKDREFSRSSMAIDTKESF